SGALQRRTHWFPRASRVSPIGRRSTCLPVEPRDCHDIRAAEDAMPYSPEHRQRTRKRIVRSAMVLFNRHGFESVSIDDVMRHAGLTRGGFYRHFETKSALYAEAVSLSLAETPWSRWDGVDVDFSAHDAAAQVVRAYLSRAHLEDVDGSCSMVALPSDVARAPSRVKTAFESRFRARVARFEESVRARGNAARDTALAVAGICVGGMVVSRAVDDSELGDALRRAVMRVALRLGGWSKEARRPSPQRAGSAESAPTGHPR